MSVLLAALLLFSGGIIGVKLISRHELRHALAAAIAAVHQGVPRKAYDAALVHVHVDDEHGEFAVEFPADVKEDLRLAVHRLAASGPLAKAENVVELIRKGDTAALVAAGDLSSRDVELITAFEGPPTAPIVVALGVQHLQKRLGERRFSAMSKLLRDVSNQAVTELHLSDVVPYTEAAAALKAAQAQLDDIINPPVSPEAAARMRVGDMVTAKVKKPPAKRRTIR